MQYVEIRDGMAARILSSSKIPKGVSKLPKDHQLTVGDDVRFFDSSWKRKGVEQCREEGLITYSDKAHIDVRWRGGKWDVRADYTKERYWDKNTGEEVRLKIGEEPQSNHTKVVKSDPEALWSEKDGWYVPQSVLDKRREEEIEQELKEKDIASIRALRASVLGKATEEDTSKLAEIESEVEALRAEKEALQKDSVVKG